MLKKYLRFMNKETKEFRKKFFVIVSFSFVVYLLALFSSFLGKRLIERLQSFDVHSIVYISLISILLFIISSFFSYFVGVVETKLSNDIKIKVQKNFYKTIQLSYYENINYKSSSEIYYRMFKDINAMIDFYVKLFISFPLNIILIITSLTIMMFINVELSLFLVFCAFFQVITMILAKKPLRKISKIRIDNEQKLIKEVNDNFLVDDLSRSLGIEDFIFKKTSPFFENLKKSNIKFVSYNLFSNSFIGLIGQIINFVSLILGIYFVYKGFLNFGSLFLLYNLINFFANSLSSILGIYPNWLLSNACFSHYLECTKYVDIKRLEATKLFSHSSDIRIVNLSFKYLDGNIVFKNLNCVIAKNKINLISGKNGTGKSTLLKILKKMLYKDDGRILFDNNIDIDEINYNDFSQNVLFLSASSKLFDGTLLENLLIGYDKRVSDEFLNEIINLCGLDSLILKLPEGLNTQIGKTQKLLSDGEIKKVSLARILIRKPKILLLDEPFVHIDNISKNEICNSIKIYYLNYHPTIIITSHEQFFIDLDINVISL